jgi:HEAT repeat protein
LRHPSILVRANAAEAIGRLADQPDQFVADLARAATDPVNSALLMGTIRVAHVAVAALVRLGTPRALAEAQLLIQQWPEPERGDLFRYLRSEALLPDPEPRLV